MSIYICYKRGDRQPIFTITDELFDILSGPLEEFEKKTGVYIDNYGNSRLYYQHSMLLLQLITNDINNKKQLPERSVMNFITFLEEAINNKTDLELIGD